MNNCAYFAAGNVRFVSAMPLSITPPEVAAAGLTAAQVPAKNSSEGAVLQVLPGAVDMMLLFQVYYCVKFFCFIFSWNKLI